MSRWKRPGAGPLSYEYPASTVEATPMTPPPAAAALVAALLEEGLLRRGSGGYPEDDVSNSRYNEEANERILAALAAAGYAITPADTGAAVALDADRLTAIIDSRMSKELAFLGDDGKTVTMLDPEQVGWALAHLYQTGDVVSGLAALAASGWQLVKDEPSAVGVTREGEGLRAALERLANAADQPLTINSGDDSEWDELREAVEQARAALASGEGT